MPDPHQLMLTEALSVSAQSVYGRGGVLQELEPVPGAGWHRARARRGSESDAGADAAPARPSVQPGNGCDYRHASGASYASAKFVRGPVYFGVMAILATEYNIIGHDHSHGVIGHWS